MAKLETDRKNDQARSTPIREIRQRRAGWREQSARLSSSLPLSQWPRHLLPNPWNNGALDHRKGSLERVRMLNEYVEDLYERVPIGTTVVVVRGMDPVSYLVSRPSDVQVAP